MLPPPRARYVRLCVAVQEGQVLLVPGATFRVTAAYLGDVIALGQRNIRATAFKLPEAPRARAPPPCIIVEMVEEAPAAV
jgi:hypothetical protein